jgi:hypothetical protein
LVDAVFKKKYKAYMDATVKVVLQRWSNSSVSIA